MYIQVNDNTMSNVFRKTGTYADIKAIKFSSFNDALLSNVTDLVIEAAYSEYLNHSGVILQLGFVDTPPVKLHLTIDELTEFSAHLAAFINSLPKSIRE